MTADDEFEAELTLLDLIEAFHKCILIKTNEESKELDSDDLADILSLTRYLRWSYSQPALATSINSLQRHDGIHGHITWWETVALATPYIKDKWHIPVFTSVNSDKENDPFFEQAQPNSLAVVSESHVASKFTSIEKRDSAKSEIDSTRESSEIQINSVEADLEQHFMEIDLNDDYPIKLDNDIVSVNSSEGLPEMLNSQTQAQQASDSAHNYYNSTYSSPSKKGFFESIKNAISFGLSRSSSPSCSPSGNPQTPQKGVTQNLQNPNDHVQKCDSHSPSRTITSEGWSTFLSPRGQQQSQSEKSVFSQNVSYSRADITDTIENSIDRQSIFSTEDLTRSQHFQLNESRSSAGSFKPPKPQQSSISDGFRTPRLSCDDASDIDIDNDTRRSQSPVKRNYDNSLQYDDYHYTLGSTLGSAESEISFNSAFGPPDVRRSITGFRRSITSTVSGRNSTFGCRNGVGLSALIRAELQNSYNYDSVTTPAVNLEKSPLNSNHMSLSLGNPDFIYNSEYLHIDSFSHISKEANNTGLDYGYRMEHHSPSTGRARISLGSVKSQNDAINRLKQMIQRSQEREKDDALTCFNPYGGLLDQATSMEPEDEKYNDSNCWEAYYNRSQPRCLQREKVEESRKELLLSLNELLPPRSVPFLHSQKFNPKSPLLDHHDMISTKINHCTIIHSSAENAISPEFSSPRGGLPCPPQLSMTTGELSDHDLNLGVAFSGQVERKTSRGFYAQRFMVLYGRRASATDSTLNMTLKPLPPTLCLYSAVVQTAWGSVPIRPKSCIMASDLLAVAIEEPKKVSRNLFQITARPWAGQSHLDMYINSPSSPQSYQPGNSLTQNCQSNSMVLTNPVNDTAALSAGENLKLVFAAPSALDRLSWIEWLQVAKSNRNNRSQFR